jgi:glutamyl-tRNA reductase
MQRLLLAGLNHVTAPLALRERLVFTGPQVGLALQAFRQRFREAEAVLLSTCNRVELYVGRGVHGHPREQEMVDFLAGFHGLAPADLSGHVYVRADRQVVGHLFAVACSLDSMVLGETQIIGQVRQAYELARTEGTAGAILHPLFQAALAVGKEVLSQTGLAEGRVSVGSVAVEYARRIFDHFADKTILCVGAGKMAGLVVRSFQALAPGRLLICNRQTLRAAELAQQHGGEPVAWEQLPEHLAAADIVITSTSSPQPIITRGLFESLRRRRRYRPVFLIDIALPRNVEPAVGELENVYLYNIDDLQDVVAATHTQRAGAVDTARQLIEQRIAEFVSAQQTRQMGPVIEALFQRCHAMAAEEAARTCHKLGHLDNAQREHVEDLARRIVNKILHDPVRLLREGQGLTGTPQQYLHAVERLFGLSGPGETRKEEG